MGTGDHLFPFFAGLDCGRLHAEKLDLDEGPEANVVTR